VKTIILTVLTVLTTLLAGGSAFYYYRVRTAVPPANGDVVRDVSESVLSDCDCTTAMVRQAFKQRNLIKGSKLTVIATGDRSTADEPVSVASYDAPSTRQAIEGRRSIRRKHDALLQDLHQKCEQLPKTKRSPIVLAIRRAIEGLKAEGCKPYSGCFVFVQSDGLENSDVRVRLLLATNNDSALPRPLIDNDGIDVVFYGLSDTSGEEPSPGKNRQIARPRNAVRVDRLEAVWRSIFTHPERLSFQPFCPKTTTASQ
jgi:hypothetical protein